MKRYIDADKLKAEIERLIQNLRGIAVDYPMLAQTMRLSFEGLLSFIASLQQDDTQVDKMLCSQVWWEEQGWIMIPPDVTIEGIDSLLKQVRKKLQQEQPEVDLEEEVRKYCGSSFRFNYDELNDSFYSNTFEFDDVVELARHFYDLGRNTKKQ